MKSLSNAGFSASPSVELTEGDAEWADAYSNWIDGKQPTNSNEWKKGIHFCLFTHNEKKAKIDEENKIYKEKVEAEFADWVSWFVI